MARILIVDDDSDVRRMLRFVLERSGHLIEEAEDGSEGLRKAVAAPYDAAVVDYQMPPPDGVELLGRLRDIQPRCVRILTSGALDLPVVLNAINRGEVSRVIEKPFTRHTILEAIDEAVAARTRLEELCIGARRDSFAVQRRQLEECLSGNMLTLALQPIVSAADRSIHGYEALLRSSHATLDSAIRVIAAAESHDLLGRLADRVTECAAEWLVNLPEDVALFVNVHPGELSNAEEVRRRYDQLRPWASRVVLEITERSYVLEMDTWRCAVASLTEAGFRIAVDDLGSGYNSLSVLAGLRPQFMKVDRSIVQQIEKDDRKQRLVELLVLFARATGTKLIVEGIETLEEDEVVKRIGADLLQGYLYGRPGSAPGRP